MAKPVNAKKLQAKIFAQAYLDNGLNATKAVMAIKPELTPESASNAGTRLLALDETASAIDSITASARDLWIEIAKDCVQRLHKQSVDDPDPVARASAHRLLIDYGKILAPVSQGPKTAIQNNKYMLPKR